MPDQVPRLASVQVQPQTHARFDDDAVQFITLFSLVIMPGPDRQGLSIHTSSNSGRCDLEGLTAKDLLTLHDAIDDWLQKRGVHKE